MNTKLNGTEQMQCPKRQVLLINSVLIKDEQLMKLKHNCAHLKCIINMEENVLLK